MRTFERPITALLMAVALNAFGQGEVLTPLSARPAPETLRSLRKSDGPNTYFIYQNAPQALPIFDDFSIDRTRNRWAQPTDAGVSLTETIYELEVGGVSTPDMVYALDTTFTYLTDAVVPPTTVRTALPEVTVLVRNIAVYPPTETTVQAWPNYNVFDTIQNPSPDTLDLTTQSLAQDSLLVYTVAPDPRTYIQPDNSGVPLILWQDDDVYLNGNYPIDPPSIGVATFDGLARTGYPYNFPVYSSYGIADHLTSVPIDLQYDPADSVYLSFFYQPQGLSGDNNVQAQDSLVLEFYAPIEQLWYRVWRTPYLPLQDFEQVLVPIKEPRFLKDGFQFRFLNYATLSGSFDHWHLDYVRLGEQRTFDDTRLIDVAYVYPVSSLLETYTSVPFNKFLQAPEAYMAASITAPIRNLDVVDKFIEYGLLAKEENAGPPFAFANGLNTSGNLLSIFPSTHAINSAPNDFVYDPALSTDAAFWRVKLFLDTEPDLISYNDTSMFIQEISNYMSYDDGSAEMGYGLNVAGGRLAYRYDIIGGDSLRAIRMYFNPQANQPPSAPPTTGSFLITVWSSLDPAVVAHQNISFSTPEYRRDGIDHFVEYPLDSTIYVQGTFYIGWTQTNTANMNIGFDRNRNNQNKIFYSTTSGFTGTSFEGSLMMRPVFVSATDPFASVAEPAVEAGRSGLLLYPNPSNGSVFLRCDDARNGDNIRFLDATGRVVLQSTWNGTQAVPTASLSNGIYLVQVMDREGTTLAQERLLMQH